MKHPKSPTPPCARSRLGRRAAGIASFLAISLGVATLLPHAASAAQGPIGLGTAGGFAVLAGSGITNTGTTTVTGDIGSFPTPTATGLGSMVLAGVNHAGDAVTQQAKIDLQTAYNDAAAANPPALVATELGGLTLTPGVYNSATLQITGTLTLDTLGDPNAVFVFQTPETLITASNSAVVVRNGARACNVYWQVGSSATLGTSSLLVGTVLASTSITATTGAAVQGRLLALNGAVTLDTNTITNTGCASTGVITTPTTAPATTVAPTTSTPSTSTSTPSTSTPTTGPTTPPTLVTSPAGSNPPGSSSDGRTPPTVPGSPSRVPTPGVTPAPPSAPGTGTDLTGANPPAPLAPPTTMITGRPALPSTGSTPRLPVVGALLLTTGVLLLTQSARGAKTPDTG